MIMMKISRSLQGLNGIVPPLVTPLTLDMQLDVSGFEKLINHVIDGGVHGIFVLGTTGELSRLSYDLRKSVIEHACRIANKRVPVLVGVTDTSIDETIRLEKIAHECGAEAVVVAPPFYYHVEQDELLSYFEELASAMDLPIYLYNMPARTKIHISIDTVLKASEIEGVIGLKDSSGDFFYLQELLFKLKGKKDFKVFVGPEEIMAQCVLTGCDGGVNGGANIFPELFVELYEAAAAGDFQLVKLLQDQVTHLSTALYKVGGKQANFIKILKEALHQKGICGPQMAKPYIPMHESERQEVKRVLKSLALSATEIKHNL